MGISYPMRPFFTDNVMMIDDRGCHSPGSCIKAPIYLL